MPKESPVETTQKMSRNAIALADISNPTVRKALDVWEKVRAERPMPSRADMGPRALLGLLSNTAVVRVLDEGNDFQFRIVGDQVRIQQGMPLQGKTTAEVDALMPGYGALLRRIYRNAYQAAKPVAFRGWYDRPQDNHPFFHEVVILPVSDAGTTPDHLIVVAA